jgi:hypothetical protein
LEQEKMMEGEAQLGKMQFINVNKMAVPEWGRHHSVVL